MQIGQTWATLVRDVWFFIYWTSGVLRCWTRPWWLVWVASAVESDISKESIRQAKIAFSKAEKRPETI